MKLTQAFSQEASVDPKKEAGCLNCGATLGGRFCQTCGQDSNNPPQDGLALLASLSASILGLESRALRSFATLLFRPGRLTRAFIEGKRVRYSSPVQLYLWCTAAFFLMQTFFPVVRLDPDSGQVVSSLSAVTVGTDLSAETLQRLATQGTPLPVFAERFDAAVTAYFPVLLLALVAAAGLLMALQFWREPALKHAVFALHWAAFYFTLEMLRQTLPSLGRWSVPLSIGTTIIALAYLFASMMVVYRRNWAPTLLKALLSTVIFGALLGGWLLSTVAVAERIA